MQTMSSAVHNVPSPQVSVTPRQLLASGPRLVQKSISAFFGRHNPHPHRVTHIKGLLDLPICVVNDDIGISTWGHQSPQMNFPPNGFAEQKIRSYSPLRHSIPVSSMNVLGAQGRTWPSDTIAGLQYFTGLRNFSFREKAVPYIGFVPITETWRQQLRLLTQAAYQPIIEDTNSRRKLAESQQAETQLQHPAEWLCASQSNVNLQQATRTGARAMYSPMSGRLMPLTSGQSHTSRHAMGRRLLSGVPAVRSSGQEMATYEHLTAVDDMESQVFTMICSILQTEDVHAVKAWLASATEREKALVLDIVRAALSNREEYYNLNPEGKLKKLPEEKRSEINKLPPIEEQLNGIVGASAQADRLLVHDSEASGKQHDLGDARDPACTDLTRPPTSGTFRISTGATRPANTTDDLPLSAPMRKSKTNLDNVFGAIQEIPENTWNPDASVVPVRREL